VADFVYEIACSGDRAGEGAVRDWVNRDAGPAWAALPGLSALDIYEPVPAGTHDPYVNDGPGPLLMAMLQFPTIEKLNDALSHPQFRQSLSARPAGVAVTGTSLERHFFPVAGSAGSGPLRAPFSYVVRYHHPAQNVAEFVSHYLADHPPILSKLPEIRSVLCYLPIEGGGSGVLPAANYMLGNEVAFDSPQAFNAAMASPVRHELRAHFKSFPSFSGKNTHYSMMRRQVAPTAS
jgi:uncharacterized protein (TIGR02118 family)